MNKQIEKYHLWSPKTQRCVTLALQSNTHLDKKWLKARNNLIPSEGQVVCHI